MNDKLLNTVKSESTIYEAVIEEMSVKLKHAHLIKSAEQYVSDVRDRENYGEIEIYPDVILPHIQSENILATGIYLIKGKGQDVKWHNQKLKLIILLNLKPNEDKSIQTDIQQFMRNLADDSFIESLITEEDLL